VSSVEHDRNFIAEALPAFISEAQEQTAALEQLLLQLEDAPGNRELLDALFRCVHTVKGSAGLFGLDHVVDFTHRVESLLGRLREGELELSPEISTLLLQCNDQIRALVAASSDPPTEGTLASPAQEDLIQRVLAACGGAPAAVPPAPAEPGIPRWHVSVRFGTATFRNGMDPLAILNYARSVGTIPGIACDTGAVPELEELDPETCHLGFEFGLDTVANRPEVESIFSFVRDDSIVHLIEPKATPQDFADFIAAMPDNPRLGEILVAAGAITRLELQQCLRSQAETTAKSGRAPLLGQVLQAKADVSSQVVAAALAKQNKQRGGAAPGAAEDNRFIRVQADRLDTVINLLGELVIASAGASLLARQTRQRTLLEANHHIGRLVEEIRNGTLQLRMVPIGETFARFRRVVRDTAAELGKDVVLEIVGGETELDKSVVERIADPLMHLVRNALDHGLEPPEQRLAAGKPAQGQLTLSACHEAGSILIRIADDGRGIQRAKVLQRAWDSGLVERDFVPPDADIVKLIFEAGFSTAEQVTSLSGRGVGMDVVRRNIEALRGSVAIESVEGAGSRVEIRLPLTLAIIDGFLVGVNASKFVFPLESVVEVIEAKYDANCRDARGRRFVELRGQVLPVVSLRGLYGLDGPEPERVSTVVIKSASHRYGVVVDALLGQHQTVIKPLSPMFRSLRGVSGSSILGNGEVALIFDVNALGALAAAEDPPRLAREPMPRAAAHSSSNL
jgi:two-component system chemotaxis sensor kinase CheA